MISNMNNYDNSAKQSSVIYNKHKKKIRLKNTQLNKLDDENNTKNSILNTIHNEDCKKGFNWIADNSVDLLIADPPYGISRHLNCKGKRLGSTAKLNFEFGKWDIIDGDVTDWCNYALKKVKGWVIIFCAKRDIGAYWSHLEENEFKAIDSIVWQKPDPLPLNGKTKFLNAWESAVVGKRSSSFFGGYCTHNIFKYQAPKGKDRIHPTQKPLKLIEELIELTTKKDDVVLDPFMGSGTTALACKKLNRNFIGFEIDKKYIKLARKRIGDLGNLTI